MTLRLEIPGERAIAIDHLLLDVNGTLTDRDRLIDGVAERLSRLRDQLDLHLLSADTFGTLEELGRRLRVETRRVSRGREKRELVERLGQDRCAAIGNGRNDAAMLATVRLGIVVIGPEGASGVAVADADAVFVSIVAALDFLLEPDVAGSTLRP